MIGASLDLIFQQDVAPAHTAKSTKSWLNDQQTHQTWTPSRIYGVLSRENKRSKNADELKAAVKETWASIPPQQCHKLITSMPRRIEAVIKAKGAPTKYWVHIQYMNILSRRPTIHKKKWLVLWSILNCWDINKCEPKSSQLKEPKTNYFSLCALNLFNTQVSQFELNYWNKWTFPRHSNLLRCTCNTYKKYIIWIQWI